MKTGILFDLDGTLLETLEDLKDAVNYALIRFGYPERTLEEVRQFVGTGARNLIRKALPGQFGDEIIDTVLGVYQEYYRAHCQVKTKPYEGVLEALAEISRQYPVAIVSNKPDAAVKTLCARYFPGVYALGEADSLPRKPAPDMLFAARDILGVDRFVYVGDSEVDVQTAQNANVPCLSVLWGFRDREVLEQAGATHFCEDARQMPGILNAMIGETYVP